MVGGSWRTYPLAEVFEFASFALPISVFSRPFFSFTSPPALVSPTVFLGNPSFSSVSFSFSFPSITNLFHLFKICRSFRSFSGLNAMASNRIVSCGQHVFALSGLLSSGGDFLFRLAYPGGCGKGR